MTAMKKYSIARSHTLQLYRDEKFLIELARSLINVRLNGCGSVLVIMTSKHRKDVQAALTEEELENEGLRFLDIDDLLPQFMVEDWPNGPQFLQSMATILISARQRGRVYVFNEMTGVLFAEGKSDAALKVENMWHSLAIQHQFSLRCAYPLSALYEQGDNRTRSSVCQLHQRMQIQGDQSQY
jgi:hypothetical protein